VALAAPIGLFGGRLMASTPQPTTTTTTSAPSTTTTTTVAPSTTTTTTTSTTVAPTTTSAPDTTAPVPVARCAPATTTTTTLAGSTTTTTTTTTLARGETTTTTTTLPPCPTTTPPPTSPPETEPPPADEPAEPQRHINAGKKWNDILTTIRLVESGNTYDLPKNRGGASGAYQYIDSTWNNYKGYPSAYLAPKEIQDERALADVTAILWQWKNDVSMVPVIWYYPRAAREPALMDQVPAPWAGNRLTVREYQSRWLDMLEYVTGGPLGFRLSLLPPELRFLAGVPPEVPLSADASLAAISYPVLGPSLLAPPALCVETECGDGTDAVIYGQKYQPILAAVNGVVTAVDEGDPVSGEVSVTITDGDGRSFRYAGFNDDSPGTTDGAAIRPYRLTTIARVGTIVRAGQVLGFMGDTDPMPSNEHRGTGGDDAVWPHLRLSIFAADGTQLDADGLAAAALRRQACHVAIGPWSVPADPDLDIDPYVVDAIFNGKFTIKADGTVTAAGKMALIVPPEGCVWQPTQTFGPAAAGGKPGLGWMMPVTVSPRFWVADSGSAVNAAVAF
jgi:hypothetical protein